jgi:hypothetical protein
MVGETETKIKEETREKKESTEEAGITKGRKA